MMLGTQPPPTSPTPGGHHHFTESFVEPAIPQRRKRKAEVQDGERERLSKRLSLLNIEQNGPKLYVPVEAPPPPSANATSSHATTSQSSRPNSDEPMQLDDSKHKVYIYNIDDELSSDSECEEGKLVFLPDIEKHLKQNRIPRHILANEDGELAGMQLILYNDPKSLSVPEEQDGVRKAIIEARQRVREKQRQERGGIAPAATNKPFANGTDPASTMDMDGDDAMDID
ncbi:hypothetical protein PT974_06176 [Cladobotryum mycophilum]|uniref:Uncharacterized protein n=1 Tax=Cladobotryum mycophilum TaxID=491253 RepID=A0ABR0SLY4_9HYPO